MAKLTLNDIAGTSLTNITSGVNANNTRLETAFENTLSRDGSNPNSMSADLDMNSNRVINLPAPVDDNEAARKVDVDNLVGEAEAAQTAAEAAQAAAEDAESGAETAESNAAASAALAERWASEDEDTLVSGGKYSALHYSRKAEDSANSAESAATLLESPDYGFITATPTDTRDFGSIV